MKRTDYVGEILKKQGIKHQIEPRFQEIDFGLCSGKTWQQIQKEFPKVAKLYLTDVENLKYPKGEYIQDTKERIIAAWQEVMKINFKKIAIVGHSGGNALLLAYLKNQDTSTIETQKLGNILTIKLG